MTTEPDPYRSPSSDVSATSAASLPIEDTLRATAESLYGNRNRLFRALAVPIAVLLALTAIQWTIANGLTSGELGSVVDYASIMTMIILVQLVVWGLLAIACHRALLEDSATRPVDHGGWPGRRQWGYLWRASVVGIPLVLVGSVLSVIVRLGFGFEDYEGLDDVLTHVLLFAALLPFQYLMARLSLVLPAAALLEPMTFGQSWRQTRGMGWRLAAVLLAAPAVMTLVNPLLAIVQSTIFLPVYVISYLFNLFVAIFSIAALSLSYRWFKHRDEELSRSISDPHN